MAKTNPLNALWKSKKYVTTIVWIMSCLWVGSKTSDKTVVQGLFLSASIVLASYLLAQGYVDAHKDGGGE